MNIHSPFKKAILVAMTLTMMACGKGFDAGSSSGSGDNGSLGGGVSDGNGNGGTTAPTGSWEKVAQQTNGTVESGSTYAGQMVIQIDKARQAIVMVLPLPSAVLMPLNGAPIPELPGASIEMQTQPDGSTAMGIVIPLKYLIKGGVFSDYGKLPNGDNIPFIPVGEAHGFALSFPQQPNYRLHIYLAVNAAAAFIETPELKFPDYVVWLPGYRVKNTAQTQDVGYIQIIPNRGTFSSGVYVASRIPAPVAIMIDELLRY